MSQKRRRWRKYARSRASGHTETPRMAEERKDAQRFSCRTALKGAEEMGRVQRRIGTTLEEGDDVVQ